LPGNILYLIKRSEKTNFNIKLKLSNYVGREIGGCAEQRDGWLRQRDGWLIQCDGWLRQRDGWLRYRNGCLRQR
jgi:hypothetical protein